MEHLLTPYTAVTSIGRGVALVLAAHPDDEVLGCGGAILRHVEAGDPIHVVIVTDGGHRDDTAGASDAYIAQRQQESRDAAALLGYRGPTFWGLPDRGIEYGERLVGRLVSAMLSTEADLVYAPSSFELHPDHRALGMAAAEAVRRCGRRCRLMLYEISAPLRPNLLLDISDLVERKRAAIACFASQLERQRYDNHILALNRFRTYTLPKDVIAAEAYLAVTAEELTRDPLEIYVSEFERHRRLGLSFERAEGPLVTVIIRSIGRETLLREALDSVALQTYPNIEVLIVNAKGPDRPDLGVWCGRFPLRVASRGHPLARSAAANVGLDEAKGEYLIFLDEDDCFYANHIWSLVQTLQQQPEAGVAYAGVQAMPDPAGDASQSPVVFNTPYDPVRLRVGNYIPINAVLFARDLLKSGCRFDERLDVYEDWDFWLQLSQLTSFAHCDQISARYRPSGLSGVGLQPDPRRTREGHVQVLEKWRLHWSGIEIYELVTLLDRTQTEAATRIATLEHQLRSAQDHIDKLRQHLAAVEDTMAWRLATAFRAGRDRSFPLGTRRRAVLDRFQRLLKRLYVHGFRPARSDHSR